MEVLAIFFGTGIAIAFVAFLTGLWIDEEQKRALKDAAERWKDQAQNYADLAEEHRTEAERVQGNNEKLWASIKRMIDREGTAVKLLIRCSKRDLLDGKYAKVTPEELRTVADILNGR